MEKFDPDKFVLTKQDFLNILDRIEDRWKNNKTDNWKLILEIETVKLYFKLKSDESIRVLWNEIMKEINQVLIENSIAIDKKTGENLLTTFEMIKKGNESESI